MEVTADFSFTDQDGVAWMAEAGTVIDGASIPQPLWSTFPGSPYIGNYRRASVIHDAYYRDHRGRSRADVDRMFYRAMRADDTDWFTASLMYAAVRLFGGAAWENGVRLLYVPERTMQEFEGLRRWILEQGPDLELEELDDEISTVRERMSVEQESG